MTESILNVVKGITITPPVVGRITMGHTQLSSRNGDMRALPVRDDHFGITTLVQNKVDRGWERHPLEAGLAKANGKLTAIPVRIAFNDPNLNLQNRYSAFDNRSGRVLCSGNGEKARRLSDAGVQDIACPRPEVCKYGQAQHCKSMSRAYFRIEGNDDELGLFVLRTTSWNSLSALGTRLASLHGLTQGAMAGIPMMLVLKGKTASASFREVFYFADLVTRPGQTLLQAVNEGAEYQRTMADAGLSLTGMEDALRAGLANSDFADEIDDIDEWLPDDALIAAAGGVETKAIKAGLGNLAENLKKLAEKSAGASEVCGNVAPIAPAANQAQDAAA